MRQAKQDIHPPHQAVAEVVQGQAENSTAVAEPSPERSDSLEENEGTLSLREIPANERFLQQALGTQGDVRLPAMLLSLAALLAVLVVGFKKLKARGKRDG